MINTNGRIADAILLLIVPILLCLLLFSFRDTMRGIYELFDPPLLRRSLRRCIPRYSLRTLLIAAAILPPCLAVIAGPLFEIYLSGAWFFLFFLGYFLLMLGILLYYCAADIFGPSPRKRWEKHLDRKKSDGE